MKLIDRLSADYTSGKFNGGISVLVIYSCKGNTYNYYTSDGKFYEQVEQATKAHRTFNDFMRANNIKVTEIGKKNPIWDDNWRAVNEINPMEKSPSFKSRW